MKSSTKDLLLLGGGTAAAVAAVVFVAVTAGKRDGAPTIKTVRMWRLSSGRGTYR